MNCIFLESYDSRPPQPTSRRFVFTFERSTWFLRDQVSFCLLQYFYLLQFYEMMTKSEKSLEKCFNLGIFNQITYRTPFEWWAAFVRLSPNIRFRPEKRAVQLRVLNQQIGTPPSSQLSQTSSIPRSILSLSIGKTRNLNIWNYKYTLDVLNK